MAKNSETQATVEMPKPGPDGKIKVWDLYKKKDRRVFIVDCREGLAANPPAFSLKEPGEKNPPKSPITLKSINKAKTQTLLKIIKEKTLDVDPKECENISNMRVAIAEKLGLDE